jgi:hypothetical protein
MAGMNPHYAEVAGRAGHRCEYCGAPEAVFNFAFEVEHVLARSRGGADELENTALACRSCNLFKSDCLESVDPQSGTLVRLFDPRRDLWLEHFVVLSSGSIEGRTPIGRATANLLRLNSEAQQVARSNWIALRIYPP